MATKSYKNRSNYRLIYEKAYGPIGKDDNGRALEIHHIDGDHTNNNISNLKLVTIDEHYDLHYAQGDYGACLLMAQRMNLTPAELSLLSSEAQLKRVKEGTHHLLGGEIQSAYWTKRSQDGTHHMKQENNPAATRVKNGTHNLLGPAQNKKRIDAGTHNWLGGEQQRKQGKKQVANGTHPWLKRPDGTSRASDLLKEGRHASQQKRTCTYCDMICCPGNHAKYHGENCKKNPNKKAIL